MNRACSATCGRSWTWTLTRWRLPRVGARLWSRSYRPGLKVVMLSCVSEPRKIVQAIRLGACDYLTKPFQRAELDSVLQHVLRPGLEAVEKAGARSKNWTRIATS